MSEYDSRAYLTTLYELGSKISKRETQEIQVWVQQDNTHMNGEVYNKGDSILVEVTDQVKYLIDKGALKVI